MDQETMDIDALLPSVAIGSAKQIAWAGRKRATTCKLVAAEFKHATQTLDGSLTVLYGVQGIDAMLARARSASSTSTSSMRTRSRTADFSSSRLSPAAFALACLTHLGAATWSDAASAKWWLDFGNLSLAALVEAGARAVVREQSRLSQIAGGATPTNAEGEAILVAADRLLSSGWKP